MITLTNEKINNIILEGTFEDNNNSNISKICELLNVESYFKGKYCHIFVEDDEIQLSIYEDKDSYVSDSTNVQCFLSEPINSKLEILLLNLK